MLAVSFAARSDSMHGKIKRRDESTAEGLERELAMSTTFAPAEARRAVSRM